MSSNEPDGVGQIQMITPEQTAKLMLRAQTMKASGQESLPEFAKIMAVLHQVEAYSKQRSPKREVRFSPDQVAALRCQISAFKLLAANKPLPESLSKVVFDPNTVKAVSGLSELVNHASLVGKPIVVDKLAEEAFKRKEVVVPPTTFTSPYAFFAGRATLTEQNQRMVIPAAMPFTIDPSSIIKSREKYIKSRVDYRIQELESLYSNISQDSDLKLKTLIELKSLRLYEKQKQLKRDLLQSVSKSTTLATAIDRSAFRRMKKLTLREARNTEKHERAQRNERDKRERQKHVDYINSITAHGRDFLSFHRQQQAKVVRLGGAVQRYHQAAAKDEERRSQRMAQDRLEALKANDETAYLKLLDKTKDTRITHLLEQTDKFLKSLTVAMEKQKSSVGADMGVGVALPVSVPRPEGTSAEDAEDLDYYDSAHVHQEIVNEQPRMLVGGTLKDYQIKGLQWMVSLYNNRLNGILADEMGLGKTIQTLSLITYLIEKKRQPGPFLVIVPLSTITNWVLEFEKWAPSVVKIVYKGSPNERKNLGNLVRMGNFNVLLTTYEYIINPKDRPILCKIKWLHMIIDEGHRMKNANSKLSITLMQFYHARYRLILTGTPLQNNLPELWALLNFILPKIFNSVRSFDEWFNSPFANTVGQEKIELNEEEQLLVIRRLHKVLRPFLLRRLKKDVESELPDKVETVIKCPMSGLQHRLYDQIKNKRFGAEAFARKKALNNIVMQFRKICNHPFVFPEVEEAINPAKVNDDSLFRTAGKFELLDRILPKYQATGHRILMFFQMTQIMDIMEDFLRWRGYTYLRLDGSTKTDDRTIMLKKFNSPDNPPFLFLLSTRAGGLGLNLQTADTVIIYDSDWNPHQDLQAQDRAHRIGQKKEVRILRLITTKSVEETILARAQYKLDIDGKVIQAGKFDNKTTDRERDDLLRSLFGAEDEDEEREEKEDMEDADLNEIIARDENELELFNKMDADRTKKEAQEWKARGGRGEPPARLMPESELPAIFMQDYSMDVATGDTFFGRGARAHKEVAYDDGLNEDQWLNAIDQGDVDGFIAKKKAIKAKREERKRDRQARVAAGEAVSDSEDEPDEDGNVHEKYGDGAVLHEDEGEEEEKPRKRRARKSVVDESAPASENGDEPIGKKRRLTARQSTGPAKPKKLFAGVDPTAADTVDPTTRAAMTRVFTAAYKAVEEHSVEEEGYTRKQSDVFITLPGRNQYQDYYSLIKEPVAMDMIQHRIDSTYYKDLEGFVADFRLMFANACQYNQQGSPVHMDAVALNQVFESAISRLCPNRSIVILPEDAQTRGDHMDEDVRKPLKISLKIAKPVQALQEEESEEED